MTQPVDATVVANGSPAKKQKTSHNASIDLPSMLDSSLFSDFTIKCQDKSFNVHRVILASKGGNFFHSAVAGEMKEASDRVLDLSVDDPKAVDGLINFFYDKPMEMSADTGDMIDLYILADKYQVPDIRARIVQLFEDEVTNLMVDDPEGLQGLFEVLTSPPSEEPAKCYRELEVAVSAIAAAQHHVKDVLSIESIRENLDSYGVLAAGCAKTLETMLDAEERKMGNINPVICTNPACTGRNRRWTFKHGPRGGANRHCIFCGSAAHLINT